VKHLVDAHGGIVRVQSPDPGATFTVHFPIEAACGRAPDDQLARPDTGAEAPSLGGLSVPVGADIDALAQVAGNRPAALRVQSTR
jgi:hypothetical protein